MSAPINNTISDIELQAYIDNELSSERHAEVDEIIRNNPDLQAQVDEFRHINSGLATLFQSQLEEKVPKHISNVMASRQRATYFSQAASVFLAIIIGLISGWYGNAYFSQVLTPSPTADSLVKDAFAFHATYTPELKHPVEVSANQYQHLVSWLSKRLEADIHIPNLERAGFKLLGGRLLSSEARPAAQFMYENNNGQRLTIFARNCGDDDPETAFSYASQGNVNAFFWTDEKLSFVILADIEKQKMNNIAHDVYKQMKQ